MKAKAKRAIDVKVGSKKDWESIEAGCRKDWAEAQSSAFVYRVQMLRFKNREAETETKLF